MSGTKCWKDQSDEIAFYADRWIEGEFVVLRDAKILYTFVEPTRKDTDGRFLLGVAKKCPSGIRDLFGHDFIIEFSSELWKNLTDEQKNQAAWHEINHCRIRIDQLGEMEEDSHGRLRIFLQPHDIHFNTFQQEVDKFGLSSPEMSMLKTLVQSTRGHSGKKKEKKEEKE